MNQQEYKTSEDQNQEIHIAVMARDIQYIKQSLNEVSSRLTLMDGHFVKRDELTVAIKEISKSLETHTTAIRELEISSAMTDKNIEIFKARVGTWGTVGLIVLGLMQWFFGSFKN